MSPTAQQQSTSAIRALGRGAAVLTMADVVVGSVRRTAAAVGITAQHLVGAARTLCTPEQASGLFAGEADPARRFELARRHYRVRDVSALERQVFNRWGLWLVVTSLLVSWALLLSQRPAGFLPVVGVLLPFALPLATAVLMARAAFYHWQLRTRRLGSVREFLGQPGQWLPPGETTQVRSLGWFFAVGLAALALAPGAAFAATAIADPAAAQDLAEQLLRTVLPIELLGEGTAATQALGTLSGVLVALGTAALAYHVLVGMINTAHEGKVMGEKYVPAFSVVQVVLGVGLLIPTPSGLSAIHGVVYMAASGGSGLASEIWSGFVRRSLAPAYDIESGASASVPALSLPLPVGGMALAKQLLEIEVCHRFYSVHKAAGILVESDYRPLPHVGGETTEGNGKSRVWNYGARCGGMSIPLTPSAVADDISRRHVLVYMERRSVALSKLIYALRASGLPDKIVGASLPFQSPELNYDGTGWPVSVAAPLLVAAAEYDSYMKQAAAQFLAGRDRDVRARLIAHAETAGWMAAGSFWGAIASTGDQMIQLASERPVIHAPDLSNDWGRLQNPFKEQLGGILARLDTKWQRETEIPRLSGQDLAAIGDGESDYLNALVSKLTVASAIDALKSSAANPEASLVNLGHNMLLAGESAIVVGFPLSIAAGNALGNAAGLKAAWEWAVGWGKWLIGGTIAIGWFLAYALPMLPFIAVLWLGIGWIVFVVEAIIAAPLFAFLFIRLDGRAFVDSVQRPGAILLGNLFLRPAFGILGLIFAYYTLPLTMGVLNLWFSSAFVGQQGSHFVGLAGLLGGMAMFVYLQIQIVSRTLQLVHSVPDRISRWYGAPSESFGEGESTGSNTKALLVASQSTATHTVSAAAGGRGSATGGKGGGPAGGGIQKSGGKSLADSPAAPAKGASPAAPAAPAGGGRRRGSMLSALNDG